MRMNRKDIKRLALICLIIWMAATAVFAKQISRYLATFSIELLRENGPVDYYIEGQDIDFELAPGETLVLPVKLESHLSRVGIYLGKQDDSYDQYVFQLETEDGQIIGKTTQRLSDIKENEFLYVVSNSVTSKNSTYYIRIFSDDANTEHKPLHIKVSLASVFETAPLSVSGTESEYTLILNNRYPATRWEMIAIADLPVIVITAAIWIADTNIREVFYSWKKRVPWRKTVLAMIGLLAAVDLLLLIFPQTEYILQDGNRRNQSVKESVLALHEGVVVEQYIKMADSGNIDALGFFFATYTQVIKNGVVHVEGMDADDGDLLFSEQIKTEQIADNSYYHFQLPEPVSLYGRNVLLRIWAEYAGGSTPVALYFSENSSSTMYAVVDGEAQDNSVIFEFGNRVKICRARAAVAVTMILIIFVICYVWKFMECRQIWLKYFICVPLAAILLLLPSLSQLNFGEVTLNGMVTSLFNRGELAVSQAYEETELKRNRLVEEKFALGGRVFESFERTEIPVYGKLSNITLYFPGPSMPKNMYDIQIYWDSGNGYNLRELYTYRYIHRGAGTLSFDIPCYEIVRNAVISIGSETAGGFTGMDEFFPLNRVEINSMQQASPFFSGRTLLVYACIIGLLTLGCLWKWLRIDARLGKKRRYVNVSISLLFVIIAAIYGVVFSILIPTYQVPDEAVHQRRASAGLGDGGLAGRVSEAIGDQGLGGVTSHQGQTVDIDAYLEATTRKLDDYSLHVKPNLFTLQRPGQVIGLALGMLLQLPGYWVFQCAEFGSLAVYIAMGALTLRIIPIKKSVMMMIMLLPMAIHQAGSFSLDSFVNALSFFTIAYILHLKVDAKKVSWKQLFILLLLAVGLLLGKAIYVLLMGLVFTIPLSKLELKLGGVTITEEWIKAHKWLSAVVLAAAGCAGFAAVWFLFNGSHYITMLFEILSQFPQLVRLCVLTTLSRGKYWVYGVVANFGWFDVTVNPSFIWMVVISLFVCALIHHKRAAEQAELCHREKVFSAYDLLIWYGVLLALYVVVLMSMIGWGFTRWQIDQRLPYAVKMRLLPRIEGVQGRYFLPLVPLVFIPIHTKKDVFKGLPVGFCRICYYIFITVYSISLILARYWGIGL